MKCHEAARPDDSLSAWESEGGSLATAPDSEAASQASAEDRQERGVARDRFERRADDFVEEVIHDRQVKGSWDPTSSRSRRHRLRRMTTRGRRRPSA